MSCGVPVAVDNADHTPSSAAVFEETLITSVILVPCELSHETLIVMAEQGCNEACFERLVRNVMAIDNLEWTEANGVGSKIRAVNLQGMFVARLPAKIGIVTGVISDIASVPLVFSEKLAGWFNREFVTTDVPEPADLQLGRHT